MVLDDEIKFRVSREVKRELEDRGIKYSEICRRAVESALGREESIMHLMDDEENAFADWQDRFVRLYQFINRKLAEREKLTISETAKLEQIWKSMEARMKSREQLMEEIPELAALTYEDCFDWEKVFKIIEKYPKTLKGKLGLVQVREGILFREVRNGNFTSMEAARTKMKAELELRSAKVKEELEAKVRSAEFQKEYLIKQEETRLEEERKKAEGTKGGFE